MTPVERMRDIPATRRMPYLSRRPVDNPPAVGANLLVCLVFPILLEVLDVGWSFSVYAFIGVAALVFIGFPVLETKGRSFEEVESDIWEQALT